ncbi:MAG TPA: MBL fold metallo-hydrolase [Nitrospiraceae bacterium]|nr:MBL fold metallo-hydrolase [Nitrospiraceae bacterium]
MKLEDDFCDIVKKARLGQGRSVEAIAQASGMRAEDLSILERGSRIPTTVEARAIADTLGLRADALSAIAGAQWAPSSPPSHISTYVETVFGDIGGYEVKGYVMHESGEAILIDTAYNPTAMIQTLTQRRLRLTAICLTHGHSDHADGLEELLDYCRVPVYLGEADESLLSWSPPRELLRSPQNGETISVGTLTIRFMATPGHTPGGMCYRIEKNRGPLCFVGDTLFAGSIGRSNPATLYQTHLKSVREHVLKLPGETALLPGHGPATTVQEEIAHNPFAVPA